MDLEPENARHGVPRPKKGRQSGPEIGSAISLHPGEPFSARFPSRRGPDLRSPTHAPDRPSGHPGEPVGQLGAVRAKPSATTRKIISALVRALHLLTEGHTSRTVSSARGLD
jgi:hypothetical protein